MKIATQRKSPPYRTRRRLAEHADPFTVESLESRLLFFSSNAHLVFGDPILHGPVFFLPEPKISVVASAPTGLSQQFTVTNTGTAPLTLTSPPTLAGFTESDPDYPSFISPDAQSLLATYPPFAISTAPSTAPIAPGGSTTFVVTFSDTNASRTIVFPDINTITTDVDFGAIIAIGSNDPESPTLDADISASYEIVPYRKFKLGANGVKSTILAGNGSSAGNQDPSLPFAILENTSELSDQQFIHFGTLTAGSPAAQSSLVFANNGADALDFSLAGNGSGFTASNPVTVVAPGKTAAISVIPSLSAPGTISGSLSLTVTDTTTKQTQNFTLFVDGQVTRPAVFATFTSAAAATFVIGSPNSFTISTNGYPTASLIATSALPSGISFKDNGDGTATLSGTPTGSAASLALQFTANNAVGNAASQSFNLTLVQPAQITSADTTAFTAGATKTFSISAVGSPAPTLFTLSGTLPTGINFNPNTGTLSGSPAAGAGGAYPLILGASNGFGTAASQAFTLNVNTAPQFTSANNTAFTIGAANTFNILTSGFPTATITGSGAFPKGITLNKSGQLTGTPAITGTYKFTLTAANAVASVTQAFTLTVIQPTAFTSKGTAAFKHGQVNTFTITTTGSQPATLSDLTPVAGLTVTTTANGAAMLTSSKTLPAGTYILKFTVTAPGGQPQQQQFTLTVN